MFSIDDIIDLAIQIERNGEKILRDAQKKISNPQLTSLVEWMADEEVKHVEWFSNLKPTPRMAINDPAIEEMGKSLLRNVLGDQGFSLKDANFIKISQTKDLLSIMIEFEKDTVLFYEMIRSVVSDKETLTFLDKIIAQENQHAQKLQTFLDTDL